MYNGHVNVQISEVDLAAHQGQNMTYVQFVICVRLFLLHFRISRIIDWCQCPVILWKLIDGHQGQLGSSTRGEQPWQTPIAWSERIHKGVLLGSDRLSQVIRTLIVYGVYGQCQSVISTGIH